MKSKVKAPDFKENKFCGQGYKVQCDETMMNFKCKSHRDRSPFNITEALCIVYVNSKVHISRAFVELIPHKKAETIIPTILKNVLIGATFLLMNIRAIHLCQAWVLFIKRMPQVQIC